MVRHDDKAVKEIAFLISVTDENREEKFGVCSSLEDAAAVVGDGCECEGLRLEAHEILTIADESIARDLRRREEGIPQRLKSLFSQGQRGPSLKAWRT